MPRTDQDSIRQLVREATPQPGPPTLDRPRTAGLPQTKAERAARRFTVYMDPSVRVTMKHIAADAGLALSQLTERMLPIIQTTRQHTNLPRRQHERMVRKSSAGRPWTGIVLHSEDNGVAVDIYGAQQQDAPTIREAIDKVEEQ